MSPDSAGRIPVRRAVLSVSDTTRLGELGRALADHGAELWATAGTRAALAAAQVEARSVEELTGIGSWFGGRVKTLHPALLGGILAPRTAEGTSELANRGLLPIDLVVVNFYPFARRYAEAPGAPELPELVDIGGVTLARAAAKNFESVVVVTGPTLYAELIAALAAGAGTTDRETRQRFAARAFADVAEYDREIARAFAPATVAAGFPAEIRFAGEPFPLRYGENPHQAARRYTAVGPEPLPLPPTALERLQGEELSFNNLLDLDAALALVSEFGEPAAAVVKHATPAGVATAATLREAISGAIATDPVARYGCAIAVNRPIGAGDTEPLKGVFVDLLAAPEIDSAERGRLAGRKKLKLLRASPPPFGAPRWELRGALGRLLVQEVDQRALRPEEMRAVSGPPPSPETAEALRFAWSVVRHARSNAIVLARGTRTVGIGSGQTSRVRAVENACAVAGERARGSVLASDAFFPFADGVEAAGRAGVAAILQPGGSIRDPEVIAAAERLGIAMYLTGWRVFRH